MTNCVLIYNFNFGQFFVFIVWIIYWCWTRV